MKVVILAVSGLLVFGASAGLSWYLQKGKAEQTASAVSPQEQSANPAVSPSPASGANVTPAESQLPVAARPRPMTVEEIVKYSLALKKRDQDLSTREQELSQQEERQKLVRADIQMDQQQFTSLLASVSEQQAAVKTLIENAEHSRVQLAEEQKAAEQKRLQEDQARIVLEQEQRENIKQLSTWMQAMEPAKAAGVLKQFAEDGRLEIAVQILANFEEREAAEILSSLQDPKLIGQFVEAYRGLKKPAKTTNQRR
jgi:hypothetical protein